MKMNTGSRFAHDTFAANDGQNNFAHHPESFIEAEPPSSGGAAPQEQKRTRLTRNFIAGLKKK
jgi:hypothetical protein